jgi:diadenylate cyclase
MVPLSEILVLAIVFYYIILFFRGTRGAQVLYGFVVLLIALIALTNFFNLDALNWVLQRFSAYLAIALVVIFQPEIRRALAELGKQPVFGAAGKERTLVDHVVKAACMLAEHKIGALIAVERDIATRFIQESGTRLDSLVTPELLASLFYPRTPLHDGGVIIQNDRLVAAGCVFPLTQQEEISKKLGTRHRAAIGLTEETDAIVVVVSEETGTISIAYRGRLSRGLDEERLRRVLTSVLLRGGGKSRLNRVRQQLDLTPKGVAMTDALAATEETEHAG